MTEIIRADAPGMIAGQAQTQDSLFNRITVILFVLCICFAILVQYTDLPERTRADKERLPPQLLKIIARKPMVDKKPEPITNEPEPVIVEASEPTDDIDKIADNAAEQVTDAARAQAKVKAKNSGILAFANDLSQLHQSVISTSFDSNSSSAYQQRQQAKLKESQTRSGSYTALSASSNALSNLALETRHDLVASNADAIESALRLTPEQSDGAVSDHEELRIHTRGKKEFKLVIAAPTNTASELDLALTQLQQQAAADIAPNTLVRDSNKPINIIPVADKRPDERTTESIRQIFDKNKGALYAIYRRALRVDPSLAGKLTVDLIIGADGTVKTVALVLSELAFVELENKLMTRIGMINFGSMGSNDIRLNYTFNFLPF